MIAEQPLWGIDLKSLLALIMYRRLCSMRYDWDLIATPCLKNRPSFSPSLALWLELFGEFFFLSPPFVSLLYYQMVFLLWSDSGSKEAQMGRCGNGLILTWTMAIGYGWSHYSVPNNALLFNCSNHAIFPTFQFIWCDSIDCDWGFSVHTRGKLFESVLSYVGSRFYPIAKEGWDPVDFRDCFSAFLT